MKNHYLFASCCLLLILIPIAQSFAWNETGHKTIALIAKNNMSKLTLSKVQALLSEGESLDSVSAWADNVRTSLTKTSPWHYIDIPISRDVTLTDLPAYYNHKGDPEGNLVSQINIEIKLLKSPAAPLKKKKQAIRFLVHFIGDLHQPLHCSDSNDRGGNEKKARFKRPDNSRNKAITIPLHKLWDHIIEVKDSKKPEELYRSLNRNINQEKIKKWQHGSIEEWALESYKLAKTTIYQGLPDGKAVISLPKDYYYKMRPLAEEQLEKAGIRLAMVLENIFNP